MSAPPSHQTAGTRPVLRRRWLLVVAPLLAFLALAAWAFSSPVGSSPDDDFHLPSIWCGLGDRPGLCEDSGDPDTRLVPAAIVGEACFTRDQNASGACWDAASTPLVETDRVNVGPLYPPLFYGTMSVFASTDVVASVLAMRLFNAALFVGLTTALAFALPTALRRIAVLPFVVTLVPLGLFVVPSTNASSWAYLSAGIVWAALYGSTRSVGRRRWVLLALALGAGILGAGARADAAAFGVLAVCVVLVLTLRRDRTLIPSAVAGALIVIVSALFYLSAGQSSAATEGLVTDAPPLSGWQHVDNLLNTPSLWTGMFGGWGLGWLDTPLPAAVWVLGFGIFAIAVGLGLRSLSPRKAIALAAVFAALWLVPFALLWQSSSIVGTQVQPRYILPIAVILAGVAALGIRQRDARPLPSGVAVTGAVVLTFTTAVALHIELNRYTTGLDIRTLVPGKDAEWWWADGLAVWPAFAVGVAAFAGLLVALHAIDVTADRPRSVPQA